MESFPLRQRLAAVVFVALACALCCVRATPAQSGEDRMVTTAAPGHSGGRIVVALRSEPKTLNPVLAQDAPSRDVIRCMTADLIHINRETQKTEPALAKSGRVSRDGRQSTIRRRQGVRFSDGQALTADDVVFSFQVFFLRK